MWLMLCVDDVDNDGCFNGEELGDFFCSWVFCDEMNINCDKLIVVSYLGIFYKEIFFFVLFLIFCWLVSCILGEF